MTEDLPRNESEWKLVEHYDIKRYKCGLEAGQRVRLIADLPVTKWGSKEVVGLHRGGEIWTVLPGSSQDPVVFLLQEDGERHTWDDDPEIFKFFAIVPGLSPPSEFGRSPLQRPAPSSFGAIPSEAAHDMSLLPRPLDPEVLAGFVKISPPSHWTLWWVELPPGDAKNALHSILFENEELVSLVQPGLADRVALAVLQHGELIAVVEPLAAEYVASQSSVDMNSVAQALRMRGRKGQPGYYEQELPRSP